jgi:ribonucleotide reductase beta subunit family protein with ferritin-like domain
MSDSKSDKSVVNNNINDKDEPLLKENPNRFVLFPIRYKDIWDMYKKSVGCMWVAEEVDLSRDDFYKLNENERHFISHVLAFFAGSDGIVLENLMGRFSKEVQIPEARAFYAQQALIETVHSETYSLLIDTYIKDEVEKTRLFQAIDTIPCVAKKAKWALAWGGDSCSFASRLIAFGAVEGIFFSGSFCAIYWLKDQGKMPGLTFSNELISRDEGLHTDFACLLYKYIKHKLSQREIELIIKEAVEIEKEFIIDSLPCALLGINALLMKEYIEFVADRLVVQFGYKKIWGTANPFGFMEMISIKTQTNFFEKKVGDYGKAFVGDKTSAESYGVDDNF